MYALKSFFFNKVQKEKKIVFPSSPHGSTLSPSVGVCFRLACGRQMSGNWRVWEPGVKSPFNWCKSQVLLGPRVHWLEMQTVLLKVPPQILLGLHRTHFQLTLPGVILEQCGLGKGWGLSLSSQNGAMVGCHGYASWPQQFIPPLD